MEFFMNEMAEFDFFYTCLSLPLQFIPPILCTLSSSEPSTMGPFEATVSRNFLVSVLQITSPAPLPGVHS
jgi:hypothetical protein